MATITPRLVAEYCAKAVQLKLELSTVQVYVAAVGGYVEGSPSPVVQIVPGAMRTEGGGNGAQDGEALIRRVNLTFFCWFRMKYDMHQMTQEALVRESEGILDFMEQLRGVFSVTDLGGTTIELLRYEGGGAAQVHDEDAGILYCTMAMSALIGESLPTSYTLTAGDLGIAQ